MLGLSELYTEDFTEQMTARTQADKGTGITGAVDGGEM